MWFIDFILKIILLILLIDVGVILFSAIVILYLKITVLLEERKKQKLNNEKDFKATISIKDVEAKESEYEAKNPLTGESLGKVKSKTKAHKELKVKTSAPDWLTTKKRI